MPFMTRIPSDLTRFGLKVELVPGWETRGSSAFAPACVVDHWTAGPRGTTGRPSLNVCINGRDGLPGPLCNVYLDRNGVCVVVAAGRANHAGTGGFRGLVGNSAAYGIEAECGGDGDWTPAQRATYPRLVAALLWGLSRDASWTCGHNEWASTRKIDIRDWPMSAMRSQVAAIQAVGGNDMPLTDAEWNKLSVIVRDQVKAVLLTPVIDWDLTKPGAETSVAQQSAENAKGIAGLDNKVDILIEIVSKLAAGGGGAVDVKAVADQLTVVPKP
jgi:N-acetylmuramoyl-L-alanine amidase